jgi:hypothetical protein
LLFKELKLKGLKLNFRKKSTPLQIKKKRENQGRKKKREKKLKLEAASKLRRRYTSY